MSDEKKAHRESQRKQVRGKIEQQIKFAEEERKQQLLKRRIELARMGARLYGEGNIAEAAKNFMTYLRVLEDWKGVSRGGLTPQNFDIKVELSELVLISGVYWDLVKIMDHARSTGKQDEFRHYMDKYVMFSKGFTFQPLASEAIRKYIRNGKPVHKAEFKAAYKALSGDKCFIATSLVDVCDPDTLPRLRNFRDRRLMKTPAGRGLVKIYYRTGPGMVQVLDRCPRVIRQGVAGSLDRLAQLLS